jgi:hypothetical protein
MKSTNNFGLVATLIFVTGLALNNTANAADSVALTESQKDEVKCGPITKDPDTGDKYQDCFQNTTSNYSVTIKLAKVTMVSSGLLLTDLTKDSIVTLNIGRFSFTSSIGEAKSKLSNKAVQATWVYTHDICSKYNVDEECTKIKAITDGTYKLAIAPKSLTFTLSGKYDNDGNGQKVFTENCLGNGGGVSTATEDASLTLDQVNITLPVQYTCKVKQTTKDPDGQKGGPFNLSNITIKGKLGTNTSL